MAGGFGSGFAKEFTGLPKDLQRFLPKTVYTPILRLRLALEVASRFSLLWWQLSRRVRGS